MTDSNQKKLGNTLRSVADQLRGAMDADDFRDYVLSLIFPRYLSDNYKAASKLGKTCDDRNAKLCAIIQKIAEDPCPGLQPSLACGAAMEPKHLSRRDNAYQPRATPWVSE